MHAALRHLLAIGLLAMAPATVACSRKTAEPATVDRSLAPSLAAVRAAKDVGGDERRDDARHGTRRLAGLDTPVFVDGAQVAVLRSGELPVIPSIDLEGGGRRYRVHDYLKGIGVAPESVRSIHFHGNGDRIASLEGSELRRDKDRFVFSFLSGDTGAPLQKWDTDHLKNEFVVHEIRRVTVYVNRPSPAIHPQRQCHVGADGGCSDAIPYATGEAAKGTRVYVDGKMAGFVKRRQVTDAMLVSAAAPEPSDSRYSVVKLLASMGVDPSGIQSVELMAGDDVIARATGDQFATLAPQTYFTLPKHHHGKVKMHVPAEIQANEPGVTNRDALVSAVLVYKSTAPNRRELVAISRDTDLSVQLATIDDAREKLGRGEH